MGQNDYHPDSPYVTDNVGEFNEELDQLLSVAKRRRYHPGEIVYLQGERSRHFYFVETGRVKVSIFKEDGSEKILAIQESNTLFGESAAVDRHPYFATATVLEASDICVINIDDFERLIEKHPRVAIMIMVALVRKMRLLGLQVEDLSFLDAQKRVAHMLSKLMQEVGEKTKHGYLIHRNITHEDLASLTGLSRVTVTNTLNYLERLRIIKKKRRSYEVIDEERLAGLLV